MRQGARRFMTCIGVLKVHHLEFRDLQPSATDAQQAIGCQSVFNDSVNWHAHCGSAHVILGVVVGVVQVCRNGWHCHQHGWCLC